MLNTDHVIQSKALTYKPFSQARGDGFSGKLLMAAQVDNPEKRYIIKASMAHVAACEFMFYRLADKLGLRAARVRFVKPAKRSEFKYPACAIDFIPNAVALKYDEFIKIPECEILSNLSYILGDRDNLDFLKDENGVVYKIDHSDCFGIEDTAETWIKPKNITPSYVFYQLRKPEPQIGHYVDNDLLWDMFHNISKLSVDDFNEEFALLNEFCGKPFEAHFRHYIGALIQQCKSSD